MAMQMLLWILGIGLAGFVFALIQWRLKANARRPRDDKTWSDEDSMN